MEKPQKEFIVWLLVFGLILFLSISTAIFGQQEKVFTEWSPSFALLAIAGNQIIYLFLAIVLTRIFKNPLSEIGFRTSSWWRDVLIGIGTYFFLFAVSTLLEFLPSINEFVGFKNPDYGWMLEPEYKYLLISIPFLAGICEETFFRGYGYTVLNKNLKKPLLSVLIVSLIFALGHSYQGPDGILRNFIWAMIINGVFIWRKSLLPVILAHLLDDLPILFLLRF
jgi:membrane protease YdiL (CAAX protease family)